MGRSRVLLRESLARRRKTQKADSPLLGGDLAELGGNLLHQENGWDAAPLLRESLAIRAKAVPDDWSRFDTMSQLGGSLLGEKKYLEAEPLVVAGYEGIKVREAKILAASRRRVAEAAVRVVRLYERWDKPEKCKSGSEARAGRPPGGRVCQAVKPPIRRPINFARFRSWREFIPGRNLMPIHLGGQRTVPAARQRRGACPLRANVRCPPSQSLHPGSARHLRAG